jgi:hypothetical protein
LPPCHLAAGYFSRCKQTTLHRETLSANSKRYDQLLFSLGSALSPRTRFVSDTSFEATTTREKTHLISDLDGVTTPSWEEDFISRLDGHGLDHAVL